MDQLLGQQALLNIISHLLFITITWWSLQAIKIDSLIKPNHVLQARVLLILLTICIGTGVSNFFLDYLNWSQQIPFLF